MGSDGFILTEINNAILFSHQRSSVYSQRAVIKEQENEGDLRLDRVRR